MDNKNDKPKSVAGNIHKTAQSQAPQGQGGEKDSGPVQGGLLQVSAPKGGGAIRGIGEKFSANPVTGTGSMSVPIATSPGRSGFGPSFSLSYDSGAGNGPFGLGWNLALPAITRKTDKGLPRYFDHDELDTFILSGAEDLVPILDTSDERVVQTVTFTEGEDNYEYKVYPYRPRIEGLFARIERWKETSTGEVHWRSISKDNITTIYGATTGSRIADPTESRRVFSWLICESRDDKGNAIVYEYKAEDATGVVATAAANERNRDRTVQRYLKRVLYGNRVSCLSHIDATYCLDSTYITSTANWMFEVVFDYGEHDAAAPTPGDTGDWSCRLDPFSNYRPGFEVRTYRLCKRVLMFHHFTELSGHELVRSTDFSYRNDQIAASIAPLNPNDPDEAIIIAAETAKMKVIDFLAAVTQSGYVWNTTTSGYDTDSMPPVEFAYTEPEIDTTLRKADPQSIKNLPVGLSGAYQFADLDGEGASGILTDQGNGWFYMRNLSPAREDDDDDTRVKATFGAINVVRKKPNTSLMSGARLMDLAGDGTLDIVDFNPNAPGFYERDENGWTNFRAFAKRPNVNLDDPNLRMVDLTGDGHADIAITEGDVIRWYPSLGESGFGASEYARVPWDEESGPRVVFADGTETIFLSDMSGDGLPDIVRIRNSEVCYWPNLGYGRFGKKVAMDNPPLMDRPDQFDPKRIRLTDIDGSGTTDIIYLSGDGVKIYFNQSGNGWSDVTLITGFPIPDSVSSIQALDFLGIGTACLVWSTSLPAYRNDPVRYIDLMGGVKPHLMASTKNNLGAETKVYYAPSTRFYIQDRDKGTPWITRLSFPVHCVERVETYDHVSGNRFVTRYAYHHGYFDGIEREFRGFGMVEQWDTEEYDYQVQSGSDIPPVLTRTWFHTGAYINGKGISEHFKTEYFREPDLIVAPEDSSQDAAVKDAAFEAQLLPDTVMPDDVLQDEYLEATRALKGAVLRREVYAEDGTEKEGVPYTVTEQNYTIKRLQGRGINKHAVFYVHPRETIDYQYERNTEDPRIKHALTLAVDDYGNVTESVAVGYGHDATNADHTDQTTTWIAYTVNNVTNAIDTTGDYRTPLPYEAITYEVTGVTPSGSRFTFAEMVAANLATMTERDYGLGTTTETRKRPVEHARSIFRKNDLSDELAAGTIESQALPHESYTKVLTPECWPDAPDDFYDCVTTSMLTAAKYIDLDSDGCWWAPSGQIRYSDDSEHSSSVELTNALAHFFLPRLMIDPYENESLVTYDSNDLLLTESVDARDNTTTVTNDYRVLAPSMITDPNGNRTAFAFNELGLVTKTALMGKSTSNEGDDFDHPTTKFEYYLDEYVNSQEPVYVKSEMRIDHYYPDEPSTDTDRQVAYLYSDGFGREIQSKIQAEPGPVEGETGTIDPRWVGSGWTVYNNKGLPVKKYEPFFSTTEDYEGEVTYGVTPILFYDPLGRNIGVLHPDQTYEKVVFDPWKQESYDRNDTHGLVTNPTTDTDIGEYFSRLDGSPYGTDNYSGQVPSHHNDTPTTVYFDSLGRPFLTCEQFADGITTADYFTRTTLDIEGNALSVDDPRINDLAKYTYDMAGRTIRSISKDSGTRIMVYDLAGQPLYSWDSRNHRFRIEYDELRRPHKTTLADGDGQNEILIQWTIFGDDQTYGPGTPATGNHLGQPYIQRDGSGKTVFDSYDFKGNLLQTTLTLASDYKNVVNWSTDNLENESFMTEFTYDALNRVVTKTTPDNRDDQNNRTVATNLYNEAGLLEAVNVAVRGGSSMKFVRNIDYNARGQRTKIEYLEDDSASVTETAYEYDDDTFRLTRQITTRTDDSVVLQDLNFTYDPVGNITQVTDGATQTVFFDNGYTDGTRAYTYDSLYRLKTATGREHAGQQPQWEEYTRYQLPHVNETDALIRYTESFTYDASNNITEMDHVATNNNWTQSYEYEVDGSSNPLNNRLTHTTIGQTTLDYSHDNHGNMMLPHLEVQAWDHFDRLQKTSTQDVGSGTPETTYYVYNATGQRVRKVTENYALEGTPTKKDERIYIGDFERYRTFTSDVRDDERETVHVMDDTHRIAMVETKTYVSGSQIQNPTSLYRFQLSDQLGSACVETNETGQVITYEEYFPFGGTSFHQPSSAGNYSVKRYRYNAKERDEETGLYYYGARYYAAWLGRWTATDPAGFVDGPNVYSYVRNNPVRLFDITGNEAVGEEENINVVPPFTGGLELGPQQHNTKLDHDFIKNINTASLDELGRVDEALDELNPNAFETREELERAVFEMDPYAQPGDIDALWYSRVDVLEKLNPADTDSISPCQDGGSVLGTKKDKKKKSQKRQKNKKRSDKRSARKKSPNKGGEKEHTKNPQRKNWDKHSKKRPGDKNQKGYKFEIPEEPLLSPSPNNRLPEFDPAKNASPPVSIPPEPNPWLQYGRPFAVGTGLGIIAVTIAEDIATLGAGIVDDPVTLLLGWKLIEYGIH